MLPILFAVFAVAYATEVVGFRISLALGWLKGPVKFFAYVAPKGVMLF